MQNAYKKVSDQYLRINDLVGQITDQMRAHIKIIPGMYNRGIRVNNTQLAHRSSVLDAEVLRMSEILERLPSDDETRKRYETRVNDRINHLNMSTQNYNKWIEREKARWRWNARCCLCR